MTPRLDEGLRHEPPLMGGALPEHGIGPRTVHDRAAAYLTSGAAGAGKYLTSLSHHLLGWYSRGDLLVSSVKNDLVDAGLAHWQDPRFHHEPRLVEKHGGRLGTDLRDVPTLVTRFRRHSRAFNVDIGWQSAFPFSRYPFLHEVRLDQPGYALRLGAIVRGVIPEREVKDPFWLNSSREHLREVIKHVLSAYPDEWMHTLPNVVRLLRGVDPLTGQTSANALSKLYAEMQLNTRFSSVAANGRDMANLDAKTRENILKTIASETAWLISDPQLEAVLSGPPDFSLDDFGRDPTRPIAGFLTPPRGDESAATINRIFVELAVLIWQQREFVPEQPLGLIIDELPQLGRQVIELVARSINVLRDRNVVVLGYTQSLNALKEATSEETLRTILSASTYQAFGVTDDYGAHFISNLLGMSAMRDEHGRRQEVPLVDPTTVLRELDPASPLQYVFPYSGRPMRLARLGCVDTRRQPTREGLRVRGLNYAGQFDHGLPRYDHLKQSQK